MLEKRSDFPKKSFIEKGALFGSGGQTWLFWGELNKSKKRPFKPAILVADYFLENEFNWWSFEFCQPFKNSDLLDLFQRKKINSTWAEASFASFENQFEQIQNWFSTGEVKKVVPYVFEKAPIGEDSFLESWIHHGLKQPHGFFYGAWEQGEGLLGLTPETLISENENNIETMALAGTCTQESFSNNPQSFLQDPKENKEHDLVVESLKEKLKVFGHVSLSETKPSQAGSLVHLKTRLSVKPLKRISLDKIISDLHPTPALGCSPVEKTQEVMGWLNQKEPRGRFGAPFGISYSQNRSEIVVAIRNIIWDQKSFKIGSGCGVVHSSQIDKEWRELKSKRNSVKEMFGLL